MTQKRGQSPLWEHCGWLCFAEPGRATESADLLAVLVCMLESTPYVKGYKVSRPGSEHRSKT